MAPWQSRSLRSLLTVGGSFQTSRGQNADTGRANAHDPEVGPPPRGPYARHPQGGVIPERSVPVKAAPAGGRLLIVVLAGDSERGELPDLESGCGRAVKAGRRPPEGSLDGPGGVGPQNGM